LRITTPGADTWIHPNVFPEITVLAAVMIDGPVYAVSAVPTGTPVQLASGNAGSAHEAPDPEVGTAVDVDVGLGVAVGVAVRVAVGVAVGVAAGVGVAVTVGVVEVVGLAVGVPVVTTSSSAGSDVVAASFLVPVNLALTS
jgi:hypothetical protein